MSQPAASPLTIDWAAAAFAAAGEVCRNARPRSRIASDRSRGALVEPLELRQLLSASLAELAPAVVATGDAPQFSGIAAAEEDPNPGLTDPIPTPMPLASHDLKLQLVTSGLKSPVFATAVPGDSKRLYVVDQTGVVRVIKNGQLQSKPFLDVRDRLVDLTPEYDERGLLGLAFDPNFARNGKVYEYHSEPVGAKPADFTYALEAGQQFDHQGVIMQWKVDPKHPDKVDPNSGKELMRFDQPNMNHNGGQLMFGPDGYLYISLGDGGGADAQNGQETDGGAPTQGHSPQGNAADLTKILGKILRIDPHGTNSANGNYGIPADNPFVGGPGGARAEIYAYGFRNPYRFSFDKATGNLIAADAGQRSIEEVDVVQKGGNYGWRQKEGTFLFDPLDTQTEGVVTADSPGSPAGLIDPLAEYDHDEGSAIVGGFVYHGKNLGGAFSGKYVFGDFGQDEEEPTGELFVADLGSGDIQRLETQYGREMDKFLKGIAQGPDGELYALATSEAGPASKGYVYRITPVTSSDTHKTFNVSLDASTTPGSAAARRSGSTARA